ncbi:nucleotidyltransferase domain-containing protein [Kribbella monticola]|uniref:nucleotidyltransferase domain-containing protein n=1 Tax=Kribbella monticola TaxID=2185285 RepID=UPI0018E522C1|nr:nucleotidyltransferase domain-containing protein [Kribbella monticola]
MSARLKGRRRRADAAIDGITAWARSQADVRGLALVGSFAYGRPRMASDVDLVLVTVDKERHITGMDWADVVDRRPRLIRCQEWGPLTERRARLSSGLVVELGIVTGEWLSTPLDAGTAKVLRDGCRVLYDPENLFSHALGQL